MVIKGGVLGAGAICATTVLISATSASADVVTYTNANGLGAEAEFTLMDPTTLVIRLRNISTDAPEGFEGADQLLTSVSWDWTGLGIEILGGTVVIGDESYSVNFDTGDYFAGHDVSGEWGYGNEGNTGLKQFFITSNAAHATAFGNVNLDGPLSLDGPQGGLVADPEVVPLGGTGAIQDEIVATLNLSGELDGLGFLADGVIFEWGSDAFFSPAPGTLALFGLGGVMMARRRRRETA